LISLSNAPPWSPLSACAGTATSIAPKIATVAAHTGISVEVLP
jgi:hypothetical protein